MKSFKSCKKYLNPKTAPPTKIKLIKIWQTNFSIIPPISTELYAPWPYVGVPVGV